MDITSVTKTDTAITARAGKYSVATTHMGIELTNNAGAVIRRKNQAVSPVLLPGDPVAVTISALTANTLYHLRMYAADAPEADI
jgi:hypothetical protein